MAARLRRESPVFHLIAGPNGAGKTTFATRFLPRYAGTIHFINADMIAAGLSPLRPEAAAVAAGRLLLREFDRLSTRRESFAVETTLAGATWIRRLDELRAKGYRVRLYYLWLETADLAVQRVAERVRRGGHDVPPLVVRRRYLSGIQNLRTVTASLFDRIWIFDNTVPVARVVAIWNSRRWVVRDELRWARIQSDPS